MTDVPCGFCGIPVPQRDLGSGLQPKYCSAKCRRLRWRRDNLEKDRAVKRAYWEANQDKLREKGRAYYYETKDHQLAAQKVRYQQTRVTIPWRVIFNSAKARAKAKGIAFSLTHDWIKARWTGRCELSGLEFVLTKQGESKLFAASIDRIDPARPYEPYNCRIILQGLNALKGTAADVDVIRVCRAVVDEADKYFISNRLEGTS